MLANTYIDMCSDRREKSDKFHFNQKNVLFSWDIRTHCHRKTGRPRAENLSHCLVGDLSSREGGKGWTDHPTTLCFGLHDVPSGAHHGWRQFHVQINLEHHVTLIPAGGAYKWPGRQTQGEKLWKRLSDDSASTTPFSPLIYYHQTLMLRCCSQGTKVS